MCIRDRINDSEHVDMNIISFMEKMKLSCVEETGSNVYMEESEVPIEERESKGVSNWSRRNIKRI